MTEYDFSIQNVVGSGELPKEVDTEELEEPLESHADNSSYTWTDDGSQPGLYYEIDGDEGPQVTIHQSGSYIIRASSEEMLYDSNERVLTEFKEMGIIGEDVSIDDVKFEIVNVVALAEGDKEILLRSLDVALGQNSQYEPEIFPALQYDTQKFPVKFLVYKNCKIIVSGADSIEQAERAMETFYEELEKWT